MGKNYSVKLRDRPVFSVLSFKLPNRLELLREPGSDSVLTFSIEFAQVEDTEYREEKQILLPSSRRQISS